jgi:hypothetical protein
MDEPDAYTYSTIIVTIHTIYTVAREDIVILKVLC